VLDVPGVPCLISCVFGVLATVDFYDQSLFTADEVHNISPYRLLADKLVADDLTRAQSFPKKLLRICCIPPQASRPSSLYSVGTAHIENAPSPGALRAPTSPRVRGEVNEQRGQRE